MQTEQDKVIIERMERIIKKSVALAHIERNSRDIVTLSAILLDLMNNASNPSSKARYASKLLVQLRHMRINKDREADLECDIAMNVSYVEYLKSVKW